MAEGSLLRRRLDGSYVVDEWGLDTDLVQFVSPFLALRWRIAVEGADTLPDDGPAVLVFNRRFGLSESFVVARGVRHATGRYVRAAGAPDVAPVGPALRRMGAVLARPDELAGLLRADHVVAVGLRPSARRRHHAGEPPAELLAPALAEGVPVFPVAVTGRELGRRWRLVVGPSIERPATRGPLAVEELADRARAGVQSLLDDQYPPSLFRS
jgi:1-acyl-sn-glycerol-3-phosphate acyltransferase